MTRTTRRRLVALSLVLWIGLLALPLIARPGGGQTYSGSSSSQSSSSRSSSSSGTSRSGSSTGWSSSGSSSSGGGGDIGGLVVLLFENPLLGLLVIGGVVGYTLLVRSREGSGQARDWGTPAREFGTGADALREKMEAAAAELETSRVKGQRQSEMRVAMEGITKLDPNFSIVLFEDFVYALYAQAHTARGNGTLAELGPWISGDAHRSLAELGSGTEVNGIVIGALRYLSINGVKSDAESVSVTLEFESNYSERGEKKERRWYAVERWTLSRKKGVLSKPKDKARTLGCPSCGAPLEALRGRSCSYCKQVVAGGDFDWEVRELKSVTREPRAPGLAGHAEERGTDLPTVLDPKAKARWAKLVLRDPEMSWPKFQARLELVFNELSRGWNRQDLAAARAYLSDGLHASFSYWIEAYQAQHLRNYTEDARIVSVQMARVTGDAVYDAVTVRVFATGFDFTLDGEGNVVGGSRDRERQYSEYWTLIRGAGKRGAPRTDPECPSCGAPLAIEMTGHCSHCRVKVTSGDFDWVLSRVEQDESY